ncbi:MAG: hypothetical protein ACM359_08860 [Bacillota bacterium]
MIDARATLGQRIVEAARLAMLMHLGQLQQEASQQEATGGAGPRFSKDGELRMTGDRLLRSPHDAAGGAE